MKNPGPRLRPENAPLAEADGQIYPSDFILHPTALQRRSVSVDVNESSEASLAALGKSDPRRIVLADILHAGTIVSNEWISTSLSMEHPVPVSRTLSAGCADKDQSMKRNALPQFLIPDEKSTPMNSLDVNAQGPPPFTIDVNAQGPTPFTFSKRISTLLQR